MISKTYGTLPSYPIFLACWNGSGIGKTFGFVSDSRIGTDNLTQSQLWDEIVKAHFEYHNQDNEDAGKWVSSVLHCLEIEWV